MLARVVRNGRVGIILSNSVDHQWYSQHKIKGLLFDPFIINILESDKLIVEKQKEIAEYCLKEHPKMWWFGPWPALKIEWIPVGAQFKVIKIRHGEGYELFDSSEFITA
jgi:hypothetical protein